MGPSTAPLSNAFRMHYVNCPNAIGQTADELKLSERVVSTFAKCQKPALRIRLNHEKEEEDCSGGGGECIS